MLRSSRTLTVAIFLAVAFSFPSLGYADNDFDLSSIDFQGLDNLTGGGIYGDAPAPVPFSGEALNRALNLQPTATPATAMSTLQQAEAQAEKDAIAANNYADTVANAFTQTASLSTITSTSLGSAIWAAGVQKFLIDFASALADLASVSDFFEGMAKGDLKDNTLLQNLDSIYEMAKDGESAVNNLAGNMATGLEIEGEPPSSPVVNDVFGTMGTADGYWGTDGLTNINSLKSDFSDVANMIDDYRGGKPLNKRTLGQLIIRIGKGVAENDLKEREAHIKALEGDLVAEQAATGGLAAQMLVANQAKWKAMDALKALRAATAALTQANPESLGGAGGTGGTATSSGGKTPVVPVTVKCPECQPIADKINQGRRAMRVIQDRIAEIEAEQRALKNKKAQLKALRDALARFDRVTADARQGLRNTDVPVLGPSQEIQNDINLRGMDRLKAVNEIGRLEREIEIEEGDDPAAEVAGLRSAATKLRASLRAQRQQLDECDQEPCKDGPSTSSGDSSLADLAALLVGDASLSQSGGVTEGAAPAGVDLLDFAIFDESFQKVNYISSNCPQCSGIVRIYNATANTINGMQNELLTAEMDLDTAKGLVGNQIAYMTLLSLLRPGEVPGEKFDDLFGDAVLSVSELRIKREGGAETLRTYRQDMVAAQAKYDAVKARYDAAYDTLSRAVISLINCEKQCAVVEVLNVISLFGNNPFDRQNPLEHDHDLDGNEHDHDDSGSGSSGSGSGSGSGGGGSGPTILVLPFNGSFIPVSRLVSAGPDACAVSHFHGGSALDCDGNTQFDPAPGVCGFGPVTGTISIPLSSCANP